MSRTLLVKLGAIGDVVMAMAAVRRRLDEGARITWVTGGTVQGLIHRFLPEVETIPVEESQLLKRGRFFSAIEVLRVNSRLAFRSFGLISIGYLDLRYRLLAAGARGSRVSTFLSVPGRYHAESYYELLGGDIRQLSNRPLNPSSLIGEISGSGTGLVLAPGGAKNILRDDALRRYPISAYVRLARLALDSGKSVTVMGAHSDDWVRPYFEGLPIRFELGTLPLEEVPLWLQQFERLITHDSGPMHLGFMSGIPVTALFGPTRADEKVPRNFSANGSLVIQGGRSLPCAPCYDGKNYADCTHQQCLRDLNPSAEWLG